MLSYISNQGRYLYKNNITTETHWLSMKFFVFVTKDEEKKKHFAVKSVNKKSILFEENHFGLKFKDTVKGYIWTINCKYCIKANTTFEHCPSLMS